MAFTSQVALDINYKEEDGLNSIMQIRAHRKGSLPYWIRINGVNGPVVANEEIDAFTIGSTAERFIGVVDTFEDGSMLVQADLLLEPKYQGLDIILHIFVAGVTFEDSTLTKVIASDDFVTGEDGIARYSYQMIMLEGLVTGPCHTIAVQQDGPPISVVR